MFESKNFGYGDGTLGPEVMQNPGIIQYLVIQDLQNRLNNEVEIADSNNGFNYLAEMGATLHSQVIQCEDQYYRKLYPQRAIEAEDLYPFLSDYDYVQLQASPASIDLRMLFPKQWIYQKAVYYNETYNILEIPRTSVFNIGGYEFTLYYPIKILVNKLTTNITALYDDSIPDPLMPPTTNLLKETTFAKINSIEYFVISFPVYQMSRAIYTDDGLSEITGFKKSYQYPDQFYAAKVYTWINNSSVSGGGYWSELAYTMSEQVYDLTKPTALLNIDNVNNVLTVRIPQVYFSQGMMGARVMVEYLSTRGSMNMTLTDDMASNIEANLDPTSSSYAAMFTQNDGVMAYPYNSHSAIVGGSNPMGFDQFRNAVVNQSLYNEVPITNSQISAAVSKLGFDLTKHLDNITNRIYYAAAPLIIPNTNRVVPTIVSPVVFSDDQDLPTSVKGFSDGTITILPSTLMEYDTNQNKSRILSGSEVDALSLANISKEDVASKYNSSVYTRQPNHIWIDTNYKYPQAKTYNLSTPTLDSTYFNNENDESPILLTAVTCLVTHNQSGSQPGYYFLLKSKRTDSLGDADIAASKWIVQIPTRSGTLLNVEATYAGTETDTNLDTYSFGIPTTYRLSSDGYIQVSVTTTTGDVYTTDLSLNPTITLRALVSREATGDITRVPSLEQDIPQSYLQNYNAVTQQSMSFTLGEDLSSQVFNPVTTTWSGSEKQYQKWLDDEAYTYAQDVYLTSRNGDIVCDIVDDGQGNKSLQTVRLFQKGDDVLSGQSVQTSLTSDALKGDQTLNVSDTAGMLAGSVISGRGIVAGSIVTEVTDKTVTLSIPLIGDAPQGTTIFTTQSFIDTVTTQASAKGSTSLTIGNSERVIGGMYVYGLGIPSGTTATPQPDGVITLSQPITADIASGVTVALIDPNGQKLYRHKKGDIRYDYDGNPIVIKQAGYTYGVTMIQYDARLYMSDQPADISFVASLPSLLSSKSHSLDSIRDILLERTYLYYLPYRTMGNATYNLGDGNKTTLPLETGLNITYYVNEADKLNEDKTNLIINGTISLVNQYLQDGKISTVELGNELLTPFSGTVLDIDISGINRTDVYTASVHDDDCLPSVGYKLGLRSDGTLELSPDINIKFAVAPI